MPAALAVEDRRTIGGTPTPGMLIGCRSPSRST
jgi:hypothetical protein